MSASEFELLRSVTLGQYLPTGSVLHRLDPRVKLLSALLLLAAVTATSSLLGVILALVLVIAGFALARIPMGYALSGVRPMWVFLVLLALLQLFAIPQNNVNTVIIWHWAFLTLSARGIAAAVLLLLKFATLVWGFSLISFTTTTTQLTHGTEHLLTPLQRVGLPGHELALMLNIAFRFVPLLAEETERLMKAQASRGADFGGGGRLDFVKRARRLFPLLVPLILSSLQRAEDLILAMEARCYTGGRGRTHLIHLKANCWDYLALFVVVVVLSVTVVLGARGADASLLRAIKSI